MNLKHISTTIFLTLSLLTATYSATAAVESTVTTEKPAEIMVFGSFHFNNPGLDVVKKNVINITTAENQQYLVNLSESIAKGFSPTHVLVECSPKFQEKINQRYESYLAGEFTLPVNETYQLGFRVAKLANAQAVICFDEQSVKWNAEPLMAAMPQDAPEIQNELEERINTLTKSMTEMHATMSLKEILTDNNNQDKDIMDKSLYLLTNSVGAGDTFVGADAAASWWHRNFRMYANIQKVAQPNTRILAIAGRGHAAIIKDFVRYDTKVEGKNVNTYF